MKSLDAVSLTKLLGIYNSTPQIQITKQFSPHENQYNSLSYG
jgi:hypothetical protein